MSPVVAVGGEVRGAWAMDRDRARIGWFGEAGTMPSAALRRQVTRLSSILGRDLQAELERI
jgi:hypothetical protein